MSQRQLLGKGQFYSVFITVSLCSLIPPESSFPGNNTSSQRALLSVIMSFCQGSSQVWGGKMAPSSLLHPCMLDNTYTSIFCLQSESISHSVASDSLLPHGLLCPWNSGRNSGAGSHSLLQEVFPI